MFRVALHSVMILALLAAPAACCCTLAPSPRADSGETVRCCCCQQPSDAPANPRPDEPGQCNCKQKQSYVLTAATVAPARSADAPGEAADLPAAFAVLTAIDPSFQAAGILPVSGFTSGREALRALMVLNL